MPGHFPLVCRRFGKGWRRQVASPALRGVGLGRSSCHNSQHQRGRVAVPERDVLSREASPREPTRHCRKTEVARSNPVAADPLAGVSGAFGLPPPRCGALTTVTRRSSGRTDDSGLGHEPPTRPRDKIRKTRVLSCRPMFFRRSRSPTGELSVALDGELRR